MISNKAVIESTYVGKNVRISEFAIVRNGAILEDNVIIHPYVVIEPGCHIGADTEIYPGTYIGKRPKGVGATTRKIEYQEKVIVNSGCAIGPNAVVYYDVVIGKYSLIGDGASIRERVFIGDSSLIGRYVTINYNTKIGNHSKIMDMTHITGNCFIGDNVFISIHVSTVNDNIVTDRVYDEEKIKGPTICDHATVGANAVILPGIIVGKGAMIGAGSVVTKDVPEKVLVMGVPARIVRKI